MDLLWYAPLYPVSAALSYYIYQKETGERVERVKNELYIKSIATFIKVIQEPYTQKIIYKILNIYAIIKTPTDEDIETIFQRK